MIVIDSDILIWILRGRGDMRDAFITLAGSAENRLHITPIQIAEVFAGLREKEKIDTSLFMDSLPCLDIDASTGKLAGEFMRIYGKSHGITMADAIIGACARVFSMRLWTMNRKHYPMMAREDFVIM